MIALTTASVLLAVLAGVRAQAITLLPCGAAFYDPSKVPSPCLDYWPLPIRINLLTHPV